MGFTAVHHYLVLQFNHACDLAESEIQPTGSSSIAAFPLLRFHYTKEQRSLRQAHQHVCQLLFLVKHISPRRLGDGVVQCDTVRCSAVPYGTMLTLSGETLRTT